MMFDIHRAREVVLYECPYCGMLRFPSGDEEECGPPECYHGLLFGLNADGGGESEMLPVRYSREAA